MHELDAQGALDGAMEEVLDKMFFICDTAEQPRHELAEIEGFAAELAFTGSASGTLTIAVSDAAARTIAGDFLAALPEELSDDQVTAVTCELANMICGSVLSHADRSGTFRLGSPRPATLPISAQAHAAVRTVRFDAGTVTAHLALEPTPCPTENAFAS
jgi:CheY-specific phosphatase CheX